MVFGELGRGCHGKVKLCLDTITGEKWAIKIVEKTAKRRFQSKLSAAARAAAEGGLNPPNPHLERIKREIAILKKCAHPHVVRLREVIDDPHSDKIYLVLEYLEGGDIAWSNNAEHPKPIQSVDEARRIFRDVVCGVQYLHYQGIVHRDIKPANLLWTADHRVKISDFGVSVFVDDDTLEADELELAKTAGSPAFFAPELCAIVSQQKLPLLGAPIDIWAMGITLFCFVFGKVPFMAETEYSLFNVIVKDPLVIPDEPHITDDLRNLFHRLLEKE
ncbi:hypothetical protein BATDEDRAFT_9379, partial [Batrachochytrium dendrobatidis JAM81]